MCRIVIVDDHRTFAEALACTLAGEDNIDVVGTSWSAPDAERVVAESLPDVVLIDHHLGTDSGVDLAECLYEKNPNLRLLMFTARLDEDTALAALEAGCVGYLSKDIALEQVVRAVHAAASGQVTIDPSLFTRMLPRMISPASSNSNGLTPKELEVLERLSTGETNAQIATALYVSVNTVRNHVQNILTKLGSHSRLGAVAKALDEGIIRREPRR